MSTKEKVAKFLQERLRPVNTKHIADYFLMSKDAIHMALRKLENEGKAVRQKEGSTFYWTWKREATKPVAVPREAVKLSVPATYSRPIQNSYPQVRGYDD